MAEQQQSSKGYTEDGGTVEGTEAERLIGLKLTNVKQNVKYTSKNCCSRSFPSLKNQFLISMLCVALTCGIAAMMFLVTADFSQSSEVMTRRVLIIAPIRHTDKASRGINESNATVSHTQQSRHKAKLSVFETKIKKSLENLSAKKRRLQKSTLEQDGVVTAQEDDNGDRVDAGREDDDACYCTFSGGKCLPKAECIALAIGLSLVGTLIVIFIGCCLQLSLGWVEARDLPEEGHPSKKRRLRRHKSKEPPPKASDAQPTENESSSS